MDESQGRTVFSDDVAVQATNDDATSCKKFAVQRGYWKDDFIKFFCRTSERRSPEISRGYYARVKAINQLLSKFLKLAGEECQVVSLGAGFDTLYWQLEQEGRRPKVFVEVDFSTVTAKKCFCVKTKPNLQTALVTGDNDPIISKDEIHSRHYHLVSADLRNVNTLGDKLFSAAGLDPNLPTFFLAECVLVYLEPEKSREVIRWTARSFTNGVFLNYEPFNPFDKFGQVMEQNLMSRGCSLLGIRDCPDVESQKKRFTDCGWRNSWCLDMVEVYSLLPQDDVRRIERIDFLDEGELLTQLLKHYCLSCGFTDTCNLGFESVKL